MLKNRQIKIVKKKINQINVIFGSSFSEFEKQMIERYLQYISLEIKRSIFHACKIVGTNMIGLRSDNGFYNHNFYLSELKGAF